jgi:hypothetical protein
MSAITPTNVQRVSLGSSTLVIATFTTVADGDTWASGIPAVHTKWVDQNANPSTQASAGFATTFSGGTFTFYPGVDGLAFKLNAIIE